MTESTPETICVRTDVLRAAAKACLDYLDGGSDQVVEIPNQYRSELPYEHAADMSKVPAVSEYGVQDLEWSYNQLTRVLNGKGFLGGPVDMLHLSLILREISEKP